MRKWTVAGGLLVIDREILLVCNRRRDGRCDWTPPGGVIDEGESLLEGLGREVAEETGFVVDQWRGPVYEIRVEFVDLDMDLTVEAHQAVSWTGELTVDDPDGIVVDAAFHPGHVVAQRLEHSPRWVTEPLLAWLDDPHLRFTCHYSARGRDPRSLEVERLC